MDALLKFQVHLQSSEGQESKVLKALGTRTQLIKDNVKLERNENLTGLLGRKEADPWSVTYTLCVSDIWGNLGEGKKYTHNPQIPEGHICISKYVHFIFHVAPLWTWFVTYYSFSWIKGWAHIYKQLPHSSYVWLFILSLRTFSHTVVYLKVYWLEYFRKKGRWKQYINSSRERLEV